jgi:hypothetical protein
MKSIRTTLTTSLGRAWISATRLRSYLDMSPTDSGDFAKLDDIEYEVHLTLVKTNKNNSWEIMFDRRASSIYIASSGQQPSEKIKNKIAEILLASVTKWEQENLDELAAAEQAEIKENIQLLEERRAELFVEAESINSKIRDLQSKLV